VETNVVYLFAAAAVVWVAIFAYLLSISGRLSAMRRELQALEDERLNSSTEHGSGSQRTDAAGELG
jgi:CcmD family protein